jgi:hypothetical protein
MKLQVFASILAEIAVPINIKQPAISDHAPLYQNRFKRRPVTQH